MQYNVSFGSAFTVDQFGFVRGGTITTEPQTIVFVGKKHWSAIARLGVFLVITVLPLFLLGFGLGILVALVVIHYFCASDGSLAIEKSTITDVQRNGRKIKFKGQHPQSGETKKTVFKVDTEQNALSLENELKAK